MELPAKTLVQIDNINVEYEKFFSFSIDMLCISSYDGHFKKVNPAFEQTLGFTTEELCTKSYLDFIHPDDIEITTKQVEAQLKNGAGVLNFENRYRCRDGSYRWLSWNSAPMGQFMYAVARDITASKKATEDLKKAKESLELINRELEAFSYSAAHDLRAPVRSIVGFGGFIQSDETSQLSDESKGHLERIINAGKKMGLLIDGLLNLSHLARKVLAKHKVNLSTIAAEVCEELRLTHPHQSVQCKIKPDVYVNGDSILLKTALTNLFENAWKYTSKKTNDIHIEFGQTQINGQDVLFVRDNGVGFNMKYVEKLFGVFERLHSESEFKGTGIGLATVQRILHRHDGRIWAESEVNKGATFYFTLDLL